MYTNNNNQDPNFARKIPLWRNYCAEKNGGEICWIDPRIHPWNAHRFDSNRFPRLRTSAEPKDRALRAHGFTSSLGFPSVFASRSGCTSSNDRGRALTRSKVDFTTEPRKNCFFPREKFRRRLNKWDEISTWKIDFNRRWGYFCFVELANFYRCWRWYFRLVLIIFLKILGRSRRR